MKLNRSLLTGSLILLITFNIFNLLNFIFQFSMARMLTVEEYGVLASLFAIIYITGVFSESIQIVIAKYASVENKKSKLHFIFSKALKKSTRIGLIMLGCYLLLSILLSQLLQIPYPLLALNGGMILLSFLLPVSRGMFLGRQSFAQLGANMMLESISKLVIALGLVYIGWRLYGAMIALLLGSLIAFLLSFSSLHSVLKTKQEHAATPGIYGYTRPVFFMMLLILIFYSIDVIIAKIVFPPDTAGIYAIASILGKIVLFGTLPISKAMFPLSTQETAPVKSSKHKSNILYSATGILILCISLSLLIIFLFSSQLVSFFSGKSLEQAAQILFTLTLATSLISLANLAILYKLSRGHIRNYPFLFIFVVIEVVLLYTFSSSLNEFSLAFLTSSAMLLWGAVILLRK